MPQIGAVRRVFIVESEPHSLVPSVSEPLTAVEPRGESEPPTNLQQTYTPSATSPPPSLLHRKPSLSSSIPHTSPVRSKLYLRPDPPTTTTTATTTTRPSFPPQDRAALRVKQEDRRREYLAAKAAATRGA